MSQKILLRYGTKAQLDSIVLDNRELGFSTDTKEVYVGDGTNNYLVGRLLVGLAADRPAAAVSGRGYFAIDTGTFYIDTGTAWSSPDAASIINDAETSTSTTWSSQKISDEIAAASGTVTEWWDSVLSIESNPNTLMPGVGDRYLVGESPSLAFVGHTDDVAEWNGSGWDFYSPEVGTCLIVDNDPENIYVFSGGYWAKRAFEATTVGHGLIKTGNQISIDLPAIAGQGLDPTHYGKLNVVIDGDSIRLNVSDALEVGIVDGGTFV